MNKEEAIQLHNNLNILRYYFIQEGDLDLSDFQEYERLNIRPSHTDKSRDEHKKAAFTLGNILADSMADGELSNASRIARRMNELAEDVDIE